jgi:hypothetical protein
MAGRQSLHCCFPLSCFNRNTRRQRACGSACLGRHRSAHAQPLYNVYSQIVYDLKGSDVRTSVIDGKVVMFEGKVLTLNEGQILEEAKKYQSVIGKQ